MENNNEILIEVKNLKKYFQVGKNATLKAVDDVSFFIKKGETLGLVGESGCGKTTCGRTVMGMYTATGGDVLFDGIDVHKLDKKAKKDFARRAQIIFQDPYASLNPRMTVGDIIGEGIDIHNLYSGQKRTNRIYELLQLVGLNKEHGSRFPHEFSGGQRQRIGIARALAIEPEFIVCDEPISALDDTQALLSAIPVPDPEIERKKARIKLEGEVPSPINTKPGCRFAPRCRYAMPVCADQTPIIKEVEKEHYVACHLFD